MRSQEHIWLTFVCIALLVYFLFQQSARVLKFISNYVTIHCNHIPSSIEQLTTHCIYSFATIITFLSSQEIPWSSYYHILQRRKMRCQRFKTTRHASNICTKMKPKDMLILVPKLFEIHNIIRIHISYEFLKWLIWDSNPALIPKFMFSVRWNWEIFIVFFLFIIIRENIKKGLNGARDPREAPQDWVHFICSPQGTQPCW